VLALSLILLNAVSLQLAVAQNSQGLDPNKALTQYNLRSWDNDNGLPTNGATDIIQSPSGYIWIATYNGLFKFDGLQVKPITHLPDSLLTNGQSFRGFYKDEQGQIWLATEGNGLLKYDGAKWWRFGKKEGLTNLQVNKVLTTADGKIWIGTIKGLYVLQNGTIRQIPLNTSGSAIINAIQKDLEGNIYVGTIANGLFKLNPEGETLQHYTSTLGSMLVTELEVDKGGELWVGTDNGIHIINKRGDVLPLGLEKQPKGIITEIFADTKGNIWIGTPDGLWRYAHNEMSRFQETGLENTYKLAGSEISAIYEDGEGNVWIATVKAGFFCLSGSKFTTYTAAEGLNGNDVNFIIRCPTYGMLIATDGGINQLNQWGEIVPFKVAGKTINQAVYAILEDSKGHLWFSTLKGTFRYDGEQLEELTDEENSSHRYVRSFFEDQSGRIWLGTLNGLAYFQQGNFNKEEKSDAPHSYINYILQSSTGDIWICTNDGLYQYRNGKFSNYNTDSGLPSNIIFSAHEDTDTTIWLATQAGLVHMHKDGSFHSFTKKDGLLIYSAFQIIDDGNGFFWITSNQGIYKIAKSALKERQVPTITSSDHRLYDSYDGMKRNDCSPRHASFRDIDGAIWAATRFGIAVIEDPKNVQKNLKLPEAIIEKVIIDGQEYGTEQAITVPRDFQRISIQFTALNYVAPEKTKFSYRMANLEGQQVTSQRQVSYTHLDYGQHTFTLLAGNEDSQWSNRQATITFINEEPFYLNDAFLISLPILLGIVFMSIQKYNKRRNQKKQEALQNEVAKQTAKLEKNRNQILKQKEAIETARSKLAVQKEQLELHKTQLEDKNKELVQLNDEKNQLIGIVAHDLKSPLNQISGLVNLIEMQWEDLSDNDREQYMGFIKKSITRLNNMISQILDIEAIESKKTKVAVEKVEVNTVLQSVIENYLKTAEDKRIGLFLSAQKQKELICLADERLLFQVFANLLSNAIKFSPPGKNVYLMALQDPHSDQILIEIRDEGPGISPEDMQKLFGKYQKLSARPTAGEDSTGLGLSIVKKYVESMGGRVWCESTLGKGSSFFIAFEPWKKATEKSQLQD